jgi:hypothetical protein
MPNKHVFAKPIVVGSFASAPTSPENGLIYYDSTTNKFRVYQAGAYIDLTAGGGAATSIIVTTAATNALISVLDGSLDIKTGLQPIRYFDTSNSKSIDEMFYSDKVLVANTLAAQPIADIEFDVTVYRSVVIQTSIKEDTTGETMVGQIFLTAHSNLEISITSSFTDTEGIFVSFSADVVGNVARLKYINLGPDYDLKAHFLLRKFPI